MGTLNNQIEYFNKQIETQQQIHDSSSYSRFRGKIPVLVTYYHQNVIETTTDVGLQNVYENIGGMSSKRYNKIKNIPLYDIDKGIFNIEETETGFKGSLNSEATLIPDTIKPIPEDYFTINYQENLYLFKIISVETDTIKSNNYFKIAFKYDRADFSKIESQVVGTFNCIFDNIGSNDKSIIRDIDYDLLNKLDSVYKDVANEYINVFYNQLCSTFTLMISEKKYYDPYLIEFIKKHSLFSYNNFSFDHMLSLENTFKERYYKSIYHNVEIKNKTFENRIRELRIQDIMTYFFRSGEMYFTYELYNGQCEELYHLTHLKGFEFDIESEEFVFNIINKYINNSTDLNSYIINSLKDFYCKTTAEYFVSIPIILFIIKNTMNNITINNLL